MIDPQLIQYINEAEASQLTKAEIIHNLLEAGWLEENIREAFSSLSPAVAKKPLPMTSANRASTPADTRLLGGVSMVIGYVWLISGLDKIIGNQFVLGFSDFTKTAIANGQSFSFYKTLLSSIVTANPTLFANLIQYSELGIGLALILIGAWSLLQSSRAISILLFLASLGSSLMIANLILTLGLAFPLVDTSNAFASGVSVEYLILFTSLVLSVFYFLQI